MNETTTKGRRRRAGRRDFGTIIDEGTPTNPSFTIRWREGKRKRGKRGYETRREAQDALARIRAGRADGVLEARRPSDVGLYDAGKEWLELHSRPNLRSHKENKERWERHIKKFFGDVLLTTITPKRILEFRSHLQGKAKGNGRKAKGNGGDDKLAPRTVNQCLQELRAILRFAVVNGHLPASPTDRIGRGKLMLPVPKTKLAPPIDRPEDVGRLLAVIRRQTPRLYALFATLVYTGIRKGEACGLRWSDVDLERRMLTVRRSYTERPKSGKERDVPIPPELVPILAQHRLADPFKTDLVFTDDAGEMMTRDTKLNAILDEALEGAGLREIRLHDLRHAYASFYMMAGGNLFDLQRNLGHSTPVLTAETYAHLSADHRVKEAARVSFPEPAPDAHVVAIARGAADK